MNKDARARRLRAVGRGLALCLLGVLALLCMGIYWGDAHRERVLDVEGNYLGLPAPGEEVAEPEIPEPVISKPVIAEREIRETLHRRVAELPANLTAGIVTRRPVEPVIDAVVVPVEPPLPVEPPPAPAVVVPPVSPRPVASPDTFLADSFELPIVINVKVLVDSEIAGAHTDWIGRAQRTIGEASRVYRENFGINLRIVGVSRWPVATVGRSANQLNEELRSSPRERADILIAFVDRALGPEASALGAVEGESGHNGSYGLVGRAGDSADPFLAGTLRTVGYLLGADGKEAETASWMSSLSVSGGQRPWIDPDNRRRILTRKVKPFAPDTGRSPR